MIVAKSTRQVHRGLSSSSFACSLCICLSAESCLLSLFVADDCVDIDVFRMVAADEAVGLVAKPCERKTQYAAEAGSRACIAVGDAVGRTPCIVLDAAELHDVVARLLDIAGEDHLHTAAAAGKGLDHLVRPADHGILGSGSLHVGIPAGVVLEKDDPPVDDRRVWLACAHRFFLSF